jgi:transposase
MAVLGMSHGELSCFDTLMRVERDELCVTDAAALLGLKRRQVYRLVDRLREDGAEGLISRKRSRPGNRRHSDGLRDRIIAIVRERYADFGPTLAREHLIERHDIQVSCEALRQMMIGAGLRKDRDARRPRPYQPRYCTAFTHGDAAGASR